LFDKNDKNEIKKQVMKKSSKIRLHSKSKNLFKNSSPTKRKVLFVSY